MIKVKLNVLCTSLILLLSSLYCKAQSDTTINTPIQTIDTIINNDISIKDTLDLSKITISDSLKIKKTFLTKPQKAGLLSAALPGLGQTFNRKYWKIPIVWAGFATTGYFIYANAKPMKQAKKAYIWISETPDTPAPNDMAIQYPSTDKLEAIYNQYRTKVELFSILTAVWYALNIIDAVVDAHLSDFDISEDISINIKPGMVPFSVENNKYNNKYLSSNLSLNICFKIN